MLRSAGQLYCVAASKKIGPSFCIIRIRLARHLACGPSHSSAERHCDCWCPCHHCSGTHPCSSQTTRKRTRRPNCRGDPVRDRGQQSQQNADDALKLTAAPRQHCEVIACNKGCACLLHGLRERPRAACRHVLCGSVGTDTSTSEHGRLIAHSRSGRRQVPALQRQQRRHLVQCRCVRTQGCICITLWGHRAVRGASSHDLLCP